ncbi:SLATT domain-containing protein [Vibrio metoecus]|uniref:SLATT domain-containing protein n=1 Tax=Vibrio metoecus TaxID=1481663 RepID=UPI001303CF4D|nr:SLATT domain-containing protein [Vibrio metoecus]
MTKDDLLKAIAETGYNVGFGAKKHFATYDLVEKVPGWISFLSMVFGVYALAFDGLSTKFLSATFVVLGVVGLYVSFYNNEKEEYEKRAVKLTQLFNQLKALYLNTKSEQSQDLSIYISEHQRLETEYYSNCLTKQILFSDWYAHYKFFWQHQIEWIDEQKKFNFLRDKVPLSFSIVLVSAIVFAFLYRFEVLSSLCSLLNNG